MKRRNHFARRTLLQGAGLSLALPWFESAAAAPPPVRLVIVYTPGGTLLDRWRPRGTTDDFTLDSMLAPLEPHKRNLVFLDGVDMAVTRIGVGHPHSKGIGGALTGMPLRPGNFNTNGGNAGFADGPSVDQVIANQVGQGRRFKSLELSVAWSTGIAGGGKPHPANALTYAAAGQPIPPAVDPQATFERLVADGSADPASARAERLRQKSILDAVGKQYAAVGGRLGSEDRRKLQAHLDQLRELEKSLDAESGGAACARPALGDTASFRRDENIPRTSKQMIDLLALALACDLTRVATLQWTDSEAKHTFPWLNLADNHHAYQHDKGFQPEALAKIYNWYAGNVAKLLDALAAVKEGDGTLLDNTLLLWVSELQHPSTHGHSNMPFVLAGRAGGRLRSGRWLKFNRQPHNNLLVSVMNMMGVEGTRFGHKDFCTGPLSL